MSHRENAKGARNPRIHLLVLKILRRDTFRVRRNAAPLKRLRPRPLRQSCGAFRVRRNAAPLKLGIRRGLLPSLSAQWLGRPPCTTSTWLAHALPRHAPHLVFKQLALRLDVLGTVNHSSLGRFAEVPPGTSIPHPACYPVQCDHPTDRRGGP